MNVLIVDDEPIIRQWFAMTVDKIGDPYRIVGQAGNGKAAMSFCLDNHVDLVVTDVKMPLMNGLEFIKELKHARPHIRSLIVSSYSEFEYAAKALKYGASDYMLKAEMTVDSLQKSLQNIQSAVAMENHIFQTAQHLKEFLYENENALRAAFLNKLLLGDETSIRQFDKQSDRLQLRLRQENLAVMVLTIGQSRQAKIKEKDLLAQAIINIIDETLESEVGSGCSFSYDESTFVLFLNAKRQTNARSQLDTLLLCANQISSRLEKFLSVSSSVGLSGIAHSASRIPTLFAEAKSALGRCVFYGEQGIVPYGGFPRKGMSIDASPNLQSFIRDFQLKVDSGDYRRALERMQNMFQEVECKKHGSEKQVRAACLELLLIFIQRIRSMELDSKELATMYEDVYQQVQHAATFQQLKQWVAEKIEEFIRMMESGEQRFCEPIQKACSFMKENYNADISLQQLAEHVYLNRTYFCELFKKETGINFNDFLTQTRMEKAKDLLSQKDAKIGYVAQMVGYSNVSYFIKLFKKYTNMSPVEYKERVNKG